MFWEKQSILANMPIILVGTIVMSHGKYFDEKAGGCTTIVYCRIVYCISFDDLYRGLYFVAVIAL